MSELLQELLREYLALPSWEDAEGFVRDHPQLLGPQARTFLSVLAVDAPPQLLKHVLRPHWDLLERCGEVGVASAFAEKMAPLRVVSRALRERLRAILAADDTSALRVLLADHPELRPALKTVPVHPHTTFPLREFADAFQEVKRLEQAASTPEARMAVVAAFEALLAQLQGAAHPAFRAAVLNDLGTAHARCGHFDRAAECLQAALEFFRADTVPLEHAFTLKTLGDVHRNRQEGDREANLQRAIACYEAALVIFTPGAAPDDYGITLARLGVALLERTAGDEGRDAERAADCFERALQVTAKGTPGWANLQFDLGEAFRKQPLGDRTVHRRRAIEHYERALTVHRPQSAPGMYGRAQAGLGACLRALASGANTAQLARAVGCFQEARRCAEPALTAGEYATLRRDADDCYHEWLRVRASQGGEDGPPVPPAGRPSEAAELESMLRQLLDPGASPAEREEAQRRGGALLTRTLGRFIAARDADGFAGELAALSRLADALDREPGAAVALVELATRMLDRLPAAERPWARFHVLRLCGLGYRNLPGGDAHANLTCAIACFEEALRLQSPTREPKACGAVLNNLGNAYRNLPGGNRDAHLARAIACYEEALRLTSPEDDPTAYGTRLLNLGIAHIDAPTGGRDAGLERAIACFEEALRHLRAETAPRERAGALMNLGVALRLRAGEREEFLARAQTSFTEALRCAPAGAFPAIHAEAQQGLGQVFMARFKAGHEEAKASALACYETGLRALPPGHDLRRAAALWISLAEAHALSFSEPDAEGEARAVRCYENALRLSSPESAPGEHAAAREGLARALVRQGLREVARAAQVEEGARREEAGLGLPAGTLRVTSLKALEGLTDAFDHLAQTTSIYTPETWPSQCREVNEALGAMECARGRWREALDRFRVALDAAERLYRAGLSEHGRSKEAARNAELHRLAAFAAARTGEVETAWRVLERGKTRLLAEALRLGVPRPACVPDEEWSRFARAAEAVRAVHADRTASGFFAGGPFRSREEATRTAEAALDEAVRRVRGHAAEFLGDLHLDALRRQLGPRTALVSFCISRYGSVAFVAGTPGPVAKVELPEFGPQELERLLLARRGGPGEEDGWLSAFRERGHDAWMPAIDRALSSLGARLLRPVVEALPPGLERLVLMPSGGLALFPLHAALLSERPAERLCDRLLVSYAPSAEVLWNRFRRPARTEARGLYQAVNPTEDVGLPYALAEASAVGEGVADRLTHLGRAATRATVAAGARGRALVHLVCHGFFNWTEPRLSGLRLADGNLTLADLQAGGTDMSAAEVVALSACETGITEVTAGSPDEYVGLPAGFLLAGARCLVSSLWKVADLSTALLMERFFCVYLAGPRDAVAAMGEAQRWLRDLPATSVAEYAERCLRREGPAQQLAPVREDAEHYRRLANRQPDERLFAHPYYWAAFTVTGA